MERSRFSDPGPCEIQASETGLGAGYAVATSVDQTFTVAPAAKVATTITSFDFPGTVAYGHENGEVFTAVITNTGSKLATGTVTFATGTTTLCSTSNLVSFGSHSVVAACFIGNTQLPAGTYTVTATYSGDANNLGSVTNPGQRFTVLQDQSTTRVAESAASANLGSENAVTFSATVTSANGEAIAAGDAVTLHVGSASCNTTTNASGVASVFDCGERPREWELQRLGHLWRRRQRQRRVPRRRTR